MIKHTIKHRLHGNTGFRLYIGGPSVRVHDTQTVRCYTCCFGEMRIQNSERRCIIETGCRTINLLLCDYKLSYLSNRFVEFSWRASLLLRPHDECKAEIRDLASLRRLRTVLQGLEVKFFNRKVKIFTPHGHRELSNIRINWLFERRILRRIYFARLYEAGVVDHQIVICYRQWPSLVYD